LALSVINFGPFLLLKCGGINLSELICVDWPVLCETVYNL